MVGMCDLLLYDGAIGVTVIKSVSHAPYGLEMTTLALLKGVMRPSPSSWNSGLCLLQQPLVVGNPSCGPRSTTFTFVYSRSEITFQGHRRPGSTKRLINLYLQWLRDEGPCVLGN